MAIMLYFLVWFIQILSSFIQFFKKNFLRKNNLLFDEDQLLLIIDILSSVFQNF